MTKFLLSTAAYLIANAVGLLVAALILPGFSIGISAFILAVLIFSVLQMIAGPLLTRLSAKRFPELIGGIALVAILVGLIVTDLLMSRMAIGGISNLLAATLLVWIGSLIATFLIPRYVFKQLRSERN
ncbi:MAG: hypothetical protein AAF724_00415 [Pseudomonadota bacterium]